MDKPKVSIITAVYNDKAAMLQTLDNVADLAYPNVEYIVIDGGSSDGTQELLQTRSDVISKFVSEPDKGIADAFNKGLDRASGEYIHFLGAGDTFMASNSLCSVMEMSQHRPVLIGARIARVTADDQFLWHSKAYTKSFDKRSLLFRMSLPHQGLFTHRSFFEHFGRFDLNCRYAMDYELLLRAFHRFPSVKLSNEVVCTWKDGGIGEGHTLSIFDEYHRIKSIHKVAPFWQLKAIDRYTRLKHYIKSWL